MEPVSARRFIVVPETGESTRHGVSWGPFTLSEARQWVQKHGAGLIVFSEDENHSNPRIWNDIDPSING